MWIRSIAVLAFAVCPPLTALGQQFVPFVIPYRMSDKSEIVLPASPAVTVTSPRVVVREGHFHAGGRRVRIWGVNMCFGACFPSPADAEKIAARLAAFGINSVRFHHMDNAALPRGIWDPADATKLSAEALDRLDYFIDQLARRGIYANVNLHVSRTHARVLKLPDGSDANDYDKIVDIFTPALIDAQKRYARDLLTHVNKYRKVRYADDPAVAFVEISNEDSLFMWGWEKKLRSLPGYYADILGKLYNVWLKNRYGNTPGLEQAWAEGVPGLGENMLVGLEQRQAGPGPRWILEHRGRCSATAVGPQEGAGGVWIKIAGADGIPGNLQFMHPGLKIETGKPYTLIFRAKADKPRTINLDVSQAHGPWRTLARPMRVALTGDWQTYRLSFAATGRDDYARVNFQLGGSAAGVHLQTVTLHQGVVRVMQQGESLEAGNMALFAERENPVRVLDRMRFLAGTEKAFYDGMRSFVKTDLRCGALVAGTIVFGPLGLWAQSDMDYIDTHAYWQHPRFPGRAWDPGNWIVEQTAMVDHPERSTLFGLAACRLAGKPFTVSEYNHPAPNDYQAECVPMIASFAAAQDWDGVWLFAYSHSANEWDRGYFSSFFDIQANPAKWGFVPAGTAIFRDGGIDAAGKELIVGLSDSDDQLGDLANLHLKHGRNMSGVIGSRAKQPPMAEWLNRRLAVTLKGKGTTPQDAAAPALPLLSWKSPSGKGAFSAESGKAAVFLGNVPAGTGFHPHPYVYAMTAMDGKPLAQSARILITLCGRCENTGMAFAKDRRTVGRNWGGPPVRIEPLHREKVLLPGKWPRGFKCLALAPDGSARREVPVDGKGDEWVDLDPKLDTMWYVLTRPAKPAK